MSRRCRRFTSAASTRLPWLRRAGSGSRHRPPRSSPPACSPSSVRRTASRISSHLQPPPLHIKGFSVGDLPRPALRGRRSVLIGLGALAAGVVVDAVVPLRAQGARTLTPDPAALPGQDSLAAGEPGTAGDAPADSTTEPAAATPAAPAAPPVSARQAPSEADVVTVFDGPQPT